MNYAAAAGDPVMVCDDPEQKYVVQASAAQVDAQTDIGNVADHVATSPNTTYKQSRQELDSATLATSAAGLVILSIEQRPDNAFGDSVAVIVKINEHQLADAFAGI